MILHQSHTQDSLALYLAMKEAVESVKAELPEEVMSDLDSFVEDVEELEIDKVGGGGGGGFMLRFGSG